MDKAALDGRLWPQLADRTVGASTTIEDYHQWWLEGFKELLVGLGGFVCGPYPVQDVKACGCNQKAPGPGVGSVDKYLVVDAEAVDMVGGCR